MVLLGALIIIIAFVAIIKKVEIRLVLFLAGLVMAILAAKPLAALDAFSAAIVSCELVPAVCTVIGFVYITKLTGCDSHLVRLLSGFAARYRLVFIPGTVLLTFIVNIVVPSAVECAAALGVILIPVLISAGVRPVIAAGSVLAGTWGSVFNPSQLHNPLIAKMAGVSEGTVIAGHMVAASVSLVLAAAALTSVAVWLKEDRGVDPNTSEGESDRELKVDYLKALVPVVPLVLLILGSSVVRVIPWGVTIAEAMIFGVFFAFIVTLKKPQEITQHFFAGMGNAFADILGIIAAAAVFSKGMELIGVTGWLIEMTGHSETAAKLAAAFGPFLVAVLSGSGDAATLAFNATITPYAAQFGYGVTQMGSQAFLSGSFGRSMSPVSGATIICAALAGVSPLEVAKRNLPGMLIAVAASMLILL